MTEDELRTEEARKKGKKAFEKFKDVIPSYSSDSDEWEVVNDDNSEWEVVPDQEQKKGLFGIGKEDLARAEKEFIGGNSAMFAAMPQGMKEGLLEQIAALKGQKYQGKPISESEYPEWAETGKSFGSIIGKTPAFIGGTALGGAAGGLPGAIAGGAATGFGTTPGDMFERMIGAAEGGIMPLIPKVPGALKYIGKKGYEIVTAPFKKLQPFEHEVEKSVKNLEEVKRATDQAKLQAQIANQGKTNLEVAKAKAEQKLSELPTEAKFPYEKKPEIELKVAENNLADTEKLKGTMETWMSKYLKKGSAHDVNAAKKIKEAQEDNRKSISNEYKSIEDESKDVVIPLDNKQIIDQKTNELIDFIKNNEAYTPEARALLKELNKLEKEPTEMSAKDYLTSLRSVKQYAADARSKAYKHGMNAEERAAWEQKYNTLENKADEMDSILENSIGTDLAERLSMANKRWRTEVVPMYKNPTYQKIFHQGKIEGNIIEKLRGTDPGDVIMREIIKKDPELLKNVVGQKYAKNPSELHEENELVNEYLEKMPELKEMLSGHKLSLENISKNKQLVEDAKVFEKEVATRKALEEEISTLDKHIKELQRLANRKNISLEEKIKAEKRLEQEKEKRSKARKKLVYIGAAVGGTYFTKPYKLLE